MDVNLLQVYVVLLLVLDMIGLSGHDEGWVIFKIKDRWKREVGIC